MARRESAVPENAPGPWFVDATCIDCGVCRWVAPAVFGDAPRTAYVKEQPADPAAAGRAAVACPVGSIGGESPAIREAARAFPWPVLPGVSFCGWAQEETYGAAAWLIERPEGNVLVDVPRPVPALLDAIAARGGVRWMVLTHRDDIAHHDKVAARFGAERVMHRADAPAGIERVVDGDVQIEDLRILPLPGHTRGSIGLLWRDVLFTGDHLWGERDGSLGAGRDVCWYSWAEQRRSMERLRGLAFAHVLPGHGWPWSGGPGALEVLIARMG